MIPRAVHFALCLGNLEGSPQVMVATWQIRPARSGDAAHILSVSDEATVWLVDHGLSDQW